MHMQYKCIVVVKSLQGLVRKMYIMPVLGSSYFYSFL